MKKLKTTVRKSAELQGPTKTKKITVTDFKKETNKKPEELNNNKEVLNNNNLVPYKGFVNGNNIYFHFYKNITESYLYKVSEEYLKINKYKIGSNKDYLPIEKTDHTRKKTFVYPFNGNISKILNNYLMNIYKQQKIFILLKIEFSKLQIKPSLIILINMKKFTTIEKITTLEFIYHQHKSQ